MDLINKYPQSENRDWARRALAESYLAINKYEEAMRTLSDLGREVRIRRPLRSSVSRRRRAYGKKDYEGAVTAYERAIKESQSIRMTFPMLGTTLRRLISGLESSRELEQLP